jgi:hypothetical protein
LPKFQNQLSRRCIGTAGFGQSWSKRRWGFVIALGDYSTKSSNIAISLLFLPFALISETAIS